MSSNSSTPVRLGLIGAGRWGQNYLKTIRGLSGARLGALASRNPDSENLVDPRCRVTSRWRDLLDTTLVDGIIIATPPDMHPEMLEAVMRARIPAMIEKPFALTLSETIRLDAFQRESNAVVLVDHTHLFNSAYIELKRHASVLGPIRAIHSESGNWGPFRDYTALWDYGPHDLAMTLDLLRQAPLTVRVTTLETRPVDNHLGGEFGIELGFPNDIRADIRVGNLRNERIRRLTVGFDQHSLVFDDLATSKLVLRRPNNTHATVPVDSKPPLTRAVETFVEGIRGTITEYFGLDVAVEIARVLAHGPARL